MKFMVMNRYKYKEVFVNIGRVALILEQILSLDCNVKC